MFQEENFPLLNRVRMQKMEIDMYKVEALDWLNPTHIDKLVEEVGGVFKNGAVAESMVSHRQRIIGGNYMSAIHALIYNLHIVRGDDNSRALTTLFLKSVGTPTNLKSLLRIMDADVRTGTMRCNAIIIMGELVNILDHSWTVKFENGQHFTARYMQALGKILHDETTKEKIPHQYPEVAARCFCLKNRLWSDLTLVLRMTKDDPFTIIDILDEFDWKSIFERHEPEMHRDIDGEKQFYDTTVASLLASHAHNILVVDSDNIKARALLRKIGCRKLFHRALRRCITGELYSFPPATCTGIILFNELSNLSDYFLDCFMFSLEPPPCDDETNRLVDCAYSCVQQVFRLPKVREADPASYEDVHVVLSHIQSRALAVMRSETDELRVEKLLLLLSSRNPNFQRNIIRKIYNEEIRKDEKSGDTPCYDMCANCFVMDNDLKNQGKALLKCSSCKQITYCSRKCQKTHWKKHKQICQK